MVKPSQKTSKSFNPSMVLATFMAIVALGLVLYAPAVQWWNSYLQAKAISELNDVVDIGPETKLLAEREAAYEYNKRLLSSRDNSDYMQQLNSLGNGLMGRVKIDKINVDLPIYHTSSDEVLRKGAGHMEETTLPVGGKSTHAAITAHRGLAESKLFTDLDKVGVGDRFVLEVSGDVLTYEVETVRIVKPDETNWLVTDKDRDLVTLITCDPLGINTERMLVTGHRIDPTPITDLNNAGETSDQPGFPWWILLLVVGLCVIYVIIKFASKPKQQTNQ